VAQTADKTADKTARNTMQSGNTVQLDSHAAASLRYIRASMEAAASLAVPGSAGISSGIIGSIATALSALPALREHWLAIWLAAAVVAVAIGGTLLAQQSSLRGLTLGGAPLRKFAVGLLPSLFAGAVMTGVHWSHGNVQAIPGTWLLLYGCGLIAASAATGRSLGILGTAFFIVGAVALALPAELQIFMLGLGFGGLHLTFGIVMGRIGHGD
jgi:hypothetical protein